MELTGRLISGRYRVERLVARGGMATVYAAMDNRLDRRVALKVVHPHLAADATFRNKFVREAKMAAQLSHPNLVNVFDQDIDGDIVYLVMEYVSGITLRQALNDFKKLDAARALEIFEPVMAGLAAAHGAGILHRDIKPENVLLSDDGKIKLSDFGLARPIAAQTQTGGVVGTVAYLSPELVSRGAADARSDIYASGIMLFELLTGTQPYTGEQAVQIAMQHANSNVPAPSSVQPGIPELLDELVLWATAKHPDDRPSDAVEFHAVVARARKDLQRGQTGELTEILRNTINLRNTTRNMDGTQNLDATMRLGQNATEVIGPGANSAKQTEVFVSSDLAGEAEEPEAIGSRHRALKLLVAAVVTVLLGLSAGWYFSAGPGNFAFLPNVAGKSISAAKSTLSSAGVQLVIVHESSKSVPADAVISTDPPGGALVFGGRVTVRVSTGPKLVPAPALLGKSLVEATALILQQGFAVGRVNSWFNTAPIATIYAYNGSDGSRIPEGSKIDLEVSLGPIPVVAGMTQATAEGVLQVAGLTVKNTKEQYSDTVAKGNVIALVPLTDPIGKSGEVQLVISKGTDLVLMPNVVGQTIAAAQNYLKSLGLQVVVDTNQLTSNWGIAKVKRTNTPVGTKLRIGDSVTIISR
jgi:serine/threonine-protein kinase